MSISEFLMRIPRCPHPLRLLKLLNGLLLVLLLGCLYLLFNDLVRLDESPSFRKHTPRSQKIPSSAPEPSSLSQEMRPVQYYVEKVSGKSLFKIFHVPPKVVPTKAVAAPPPVVPVKVEDNRPKLKDMANGLVLNGIVSGNNAQAIIFNANTGKTHFVTESESIGDILIKAIRKDKVVLGYADEELDLKM